MDTEMRITVAGIRAAIRASLRSDEFLTFHDELKPLYESLRGKATFSSMEEWLHLEIVGDGRGHFSAACKASDWKAAGNKLDFSLAFDQTQLPDMISGLEAILAEFPVVG